MLPLVLLSGALVSPPSYAVETFMPPQLGQSLGETGAATVAYGVLLALSYAASALGSGAAGWFARVAGSTAHGSAVSLALTGACVAALALSDSVVVVAVLFLAYGFAAAVHEPLNATLLHDAVPAAVRATAVSAYSLTSHFGGAVGGFALAYLADRAGLSLGWIAAGIVMACAAVPLLSRRLGRASRKPGSDATEVLPTA